MRKTSLIALIAFCCSVSISLKAQQDSLTREKAALDSMLKNDPLLAMLDSLDAPGSYVDFSISMGNGIFSNQNNNLNAEQAESKQLYFTPTLAYQHKSGLAIGFSTFLATKNGKFSVYQYIVNPSYTYTGNNIQAGISYSRIIPGSQNTYTASPFSNDLYATVKWTKPWFTPGMYIGFASGKYKDYVDTVIRIPGTNPIQFRRIKDTLTNTLRDFSLSASVEHSFPAYGLLAQNDALSFTPVLMLTAGIQRLTTKHSNNLDRFPRVKQFFKSKYGDGTTSSSFALQSLNLSADLLYSVGKFYAEPLLFLDYYLPATTEKRLTAVFSFTVGVSF